MPVVGEIVFPLITERKSGSLSEESEERSGIK